MLVVAINFLGMCVGNIAGPFFFKTEQAPRYRLGIGSILVSNCLEIVAILVLRFLYIRANKKKERARRELEKGKAKPPTDETAFADLVRFLVPPGLVVLLAELSVLHLPRLDRPAECQFPLYLLVPRWFARVVSTSFSLPVMQLSVVSLSVFPVGKT
jgi:hypothetical protein